jgi:DNA polymerase
LVVCLGRIAAARIIKPDIRIKRERGTVFRKGGVMMMPVLHPAALLRNPADKAPTLEDFLKIQDILAKNGESSVLP